MNSFTVLNIEPTTDKMAIRRAYVNATKLHHPDTGGDVQKFHQIQEAYNDLVANALHENIPAIETDISISLYNLLQGCITTATIRSGEFKGTTFEFRVAPMTYPGTIITFHDSLTSRNICVKLNELKTDDYTRLDSGIVIRHTINILEAELGKTIEVTNFDKTKYTVNVSPESTADRLIYNFIGAGFYTKKSQKRGNLTVIVEVDKKRYLNV
jgi:DnaJ-class molecular chaperone